MNSEITNAFADRLERIESMLLAMTLSDGKRPNQQQHEPIKIQSEPSQTLVCKVRYDILASNIKNKLHDCLAGKGIEDLAFLNEINFEDLILSSLDTTESNEQSSSTTTLIQIDESRRDDVVSTTISHKNDTPTEPQSTTTSKPAPSLKETSAPRAKKEAAPKADKEAIKAEKEAQKAEKEAQKAEQTEMKSCEKETREYDKALQKAKAAEAKLATKPRSIPDKEAKKAEKEAEEAKKKAEKEALKAEKEAQKKAEKEAADAKKKAEKEEADARKKADKEAKKSSTSKPRKSKDATTTSVSGESISNTQSMSQPSQIIEDESSEHSNESTTSKSSSKPSLSLVHPDQFKSQEPVGIIRKSTPIPANQPSLDEDDDEENSTNTYDEDIDNKTDYEILTNWSIPSKPEVVYFAKRGQYVYECVKTEENPEGSINWNVSVGWLTSGGKHILTKSYAHYGDLIVKT